MDEQPQKEEFVSLGDILGRPKFDDLKKNVPAHVQPNVSAEPPTPPAPKTAPQKSDSRAIIASLIEHAAQTLHEAVTLLKQPGTHDMPKGAVASGLRTPSHAVPLRGTKIRGTFDGMHMVATNKKLFVSQKTISELHLSAGDSLELTITPTGAYFFQKK